MPTRSLLLFFSLFVSIVRASMRKSIERKSVKHGAGDERERERKKSRPPPRVGARRLLRMYLYPPSTTLSEDLDVKGRDS